MRGVIGVSWHGAFQLREWFTAWRDTLPEERQEMLVPQFLGWGEIEVREDAMLVFVPSMSVFKRNRDQLLDSDAVVVLFDCAVVLAQARIKNIDTDCKDGLRFTRMALTSEGFIEHLRAALNEVEEYMIEPEDVDLVPTLVANAAGSLTEALLNMTARSKVGERRREITTSYVDWLLSDRPITSLEDRLSGLGVDDDAIRYAVDWLSSKQGASARAITKKVGALRAAGKNINYDKLCKGTPVQPHDLRYLIAYARTAPVRKNDATTMEIFTQAREARAVKLSAEEKTIESLLLDEDIEGVENAAELAFQRELAGENVNY